MKSPAALGLPYDTWRTGQRSAIRTALHSRRPHVLLQAPTGLGKSLVAAALGKLQPTRRLVTLTATNGLLSQYVDIFPHLASIKGARNYECLAARDELRRYFRLSPVGTVQTCDDGPCRSGIPCTLKNDGCTYFDAIRRATAARQVVTNYAYWLAMRKYAGGLGLADVLIFDEAHALPEQLMSAFRIEISHYELSGRPPRSMKDWALWGAMMSERVKRPAGEDEDTRLRRQKAIDRFTQLSHVDETWAVDRTFTGYTFEPTIPADLFPLASDPTTQNVYLSATITLRTLQLLGLDRDTIEPLILTSSFPLERRPVYLVPSTRVDYKMDRLKRDWWLSRIDAVIRQRLDRKGIIHTVSYRRQREIVEHSAFGTRGRGLMLAPTPQSLIPDLERFRSMPPPAILVAPSIEQGYDFPMTDAEYVIIAKMPFPDTRSAIMKARIAATEGYRDHLTMQRVVQASGRAMRAEDDSCETIILDDHARWFLTKHADLAPQWFLDAMIWSTRLPTPLPKL
jgi:Rad3-related DNA helicase